MLIDIDEFNEGIISLKLDAGSYLEGSIYAPSPVQDDWLPKCWLLGSGDVDALELQLICYSITLTGNAGIRMNWDSTNFSVSPITINLEE